MKFALMVLCVIIATALASTTDEDVIKDGQEITTEIENLSKSDDDDAKAPDIQKKRESGYSYAKPARLPLNYRPSQSARLGHRRRPHSKRPSQQNRPFIQYGLPSKNSAQMQQGFVPSTGVVSQEALNANQNTNYQEPDPIASQNDIPFGTNTALYLPPKNQKPPTYSPPVTFSLSSLNHQSLLNNNPNGHQQISDAALFLTENAQTISQLYGSPASSEEYAPSNDNLFDQNSQLHLQNDAENGGDSRSNNPGQLSQDFSGPLPTYAAGILSSQETLQKLQSLKKDRLILQLQQALLQSQSAQTTNYGQGSSYDQASLGAQAPTYTFSYGVSSLPASTTAAPPAFLPPTFPSDSGKPFLTPQQPGVLQYPTLGFPPSVVTGSGIPSSYPSYGPSFVGFGNENIPIRPLDTPTHIGIPLPSRPDQRPSALPDSGGVSHVTPVIPARPSAPGLPVSPVHPISTPLQPARPVYPLRPVAPVNPVTPIQPVVTPVIVHQGHAFGTSAGNPLVYKHLKPTYPFYYGQKGTAPTQWVYPQKRAWH